MLEQPASVSTRSGRPRAVVTGASAGVGRAVAVALAGAGYDVALIARDPGRLASAARDVEAAGARAMTFALDVARAEDVIGAADEVATRWGGIDLWVNNAMVTVVAPVQAISPEEFKRVTEVTYLGQVHGTMAALRHMRQRNRGTVVQVGSALSYRPIPLQAPYCAAKFAVRGFTDSLRTELAHDGSRIRLTMVQLPAVNTPQFEWARSRMPRRLQPVPPIYAPEAIARAIVKAAEEAPRELWIGWPSIRAIVGNMLLPAQADRMAARAAWDGQMTAEPAREMSDNLFEAPPGDPGADGRFDARSRPAVLSASSASVRIAAGVLGIGVGLGAVLAAAGLARRRRGGVARRQGVLE